MSHKKHVSTAPLFVVFSLFVFETKGRFSVATEEVQPSGGGRSFGASSSSSEKEDDEEEKRLVFNPAAIFSEIFCDDITFSKDVSQKIAKEVTELHPETYKHPEDSFYGEVDVNSMLELIDLGTDGKNLDGGLRYVDLGCGVGKQVAVRLIRFYVVLFKLILLLRSF